MKVLFFSSPFFADCDFPLIREYQRKGIDVTYVISLAPYSLKSTLFNIKEQPKEDGLLPASSIPELKVYSEYMDLSNVYILNRRNKKDTSLAALKSVLTLIEFIKKVGFDVIHTDCILSMWSVLLYFFFKDKMVLTMHDPFPHTGENSFRKKVNYKIALYFVKKIVLLNEKQKEDFCEIYGIKGENVLVNRLGVYDNIVYFKSNTDVSKSSNVLFFGRISPYKGLEYLCKAMLKVRKEVPGATLTVAGGGTLYFDIEPYKKMDWLDLQNYYITMDKLALLLQQCSITVCPYTDATQSGVIMTSYALCKPTVATNVGGLVEMIEDGKSGLLVPPKNVDALADAIIKLLKNDSLCNEMSTYIKNEYHLGDKSWSFIADKYLNFYR